MSSQSYRPSTPDNDQIVRQSLSNLEEDVRIVNEGILSLNKKRQSLNKERTFPHAPSDLTQEEWEIWYHITKYEIEKIDKKQALLQSFRDALNRKLQARQEEHDRTTQPKAVKALE